MDENLIEALKLMVVGLSTVFVVLLLIIFMGNMLIAFVNRFVPEDEKLPVAQTTKVAPQVQAAIAAAVNKLTGGKGKIEHIEKL